MDHLDGLYAKLLPGRPIDSGREEDKKMSCYGTLPETVNSSILCLTIHPLIDCNVLIRIVAVEIKLPPTRVYFSNLCTYINVIIVNSDGFHCRD